jgi:glutamate/aspartate transport system permease protein
VDYNWNWGVLFQDPYLGWLFSGLRWTVAVACLAAVIAFSVGSLVGIGRTVETRWLRLISTTYVEIFRNIPLLVQMFLWYFVLPEVVPADMGRWMKREMPMPEYTSAVLCLGFYTASRVAEQVRSGIESLPRGQRMAGLATGLTPFQVYRYLLLPMAYRIIIPPLTSEFLTIFKNSSLALTIGLLELTARVQQIGEYTFQNFEAYTAATVIYVLIALVVTLLMQWLEGRVRVPGFAGRGG